MKKIFTLISMALVAMSVNAQTEESYTAVDADGNMAAEYASVIDENSVATNVVNGSVQDANGGKEVVLSDSKSDRTNEDDHMPRFTFSYQYAQRIHNVLQMDRVGRIFDNTFDHTFN